MHKNSVAYSNRLIQFQHSLLEHGLLIKLYMFGAVPSKKNVIANKNKVCPVSTAKETYSVLFYEGHHYKTKTKTFQYRQILTESRP